MKDYAPDWGDYTGDWAGGNLKLCLHNRQPVAIGQHTVWATAWADSKADTQPHPALGVYLASCWLGEANVAYVYGCKIQPPKGWYPSILVDWPDCQTPDIDILRWLIKVVRRELELGKQIEIGCLGAHGRTGTLIACLIGQVEHVGAAKAILAVRARLCEKCVECYEQVAIVYKILGERPPKRPAPIVFTPASAPAGTKGDALMSYVYHDGKLWRRFYKQGGSFEDIENSVLLASIEGEKYD